jgi:hypothetical protein
VLRLEVGGNEEQGGAVGDGCWDEKIRVPSIYMEDVKLLSSLLSRW